MPIPETSTVPTSAAAAVDSGKSDWPGALKVALYAFFLSRLLIFAVFALSLGYAEYRADPQKSAGVVRIFSPGFFQRIPEIAYFGDAGWYLNVAEHGYVKRPFDTRVQANWAFFPLHPKLWRLLIDIGIPPWLGGMLLANIFFLLALAQIWRWVRRLKDDETATRAVLCIAFWPTSYFFSLPHTESLFLLLLSSSLLAMQRGRWLSATLFAGLCSGPRLVGVLLAPLLWWQARGQVGFAKRTGLALFATFGLLAFMWILWRKTGDPLAFAHIQVAWGRESGHFLEPLQHWYRDPLVFAEPWNAQWPNLFSLLLGLGAAMWLAWRGYFGFAAFTLFSMALPWNSGSLIAMARYASTCVPIFFALACWLRRPSGFFAWMLASVSLLVLMAATFAAGELFPMT